MISPAIGGVYSTDFLRKRRRYTREIKQITEAHVVRASVFLPKFQRKMKKMKINFDY